jgi:hypothetical protein
MTTMVHTPQQRKKPAVIATLFGGGIGHVSAFAAIATLPVAAWEFSLGVWLVVKGFKPSPITAEMEAATSPPAYRDVTRDVTV